MKEEIIYTESDFNKGSLIGAEITSDSYLRPKFKEINNDKFNNPIYTNWQENIESADYIDNKIDGIQVIQPEGTYLAWLDCRELPLDDSKIHQFMIDEAGIGMNDGASFGENGKGFQRLNFGCPKSVLEKALGQIEEAVNKL